MTTTKTEHDNLQRSFQIDAEDRAIDKEANTITVSITSEYRAAMFYGDEILVHTREAVKLDRLNAGAPVYWGHPQRGGPEPEPIGVIENAWLDEPVKKVRARIRFSRNAEKAKHVVNEIRDGIITNVSPSYNVLKMERDKEDRNLFYAREWEPFEVSFLGMPADPTVGVGRSKSTPKTEVIDMNDKADGQGDLLDNDPPIKGPEYEKQLIKTHSRRAEEATQARFSQIAMMCETGKVDAAFQADLVRANVSVDEAQRRITEYRRSADASKPALIDMTPKEVKRYSLKNVISALAFPNEIAFQRAAAFEIECSRAAIEAGDEAESRGHGLRLPSGQPLQREPVRIPGDVLQRWGQRDLTALTATTGDELVAENLLADRFIDVLRNKMIMNRVGARFLPDLRGDVQIPRKTAGSTAGWIGTEGGAATESTPTFDQPSMTPKTVASWVDFTRQFLKQSSLAAEGLIRDDFARNIAIVIDESVLNGDGTGGEPTGLKSTAGMPTVDQVAAAPDFDEVLQMEETVENANALDGSFYFITTPALKRTLKQTPIETGTGIMLWTMPGYPQGPTNLLNGWPAFSSNQVEAGDSWFGNFSDVLIGMWGGLDVTVDPYSLSTTGSVRVVAFQSVDVLVRHVESFVRGNIIP